jgi:hypothetical protein
VRLGWPVGIEIEVIDHCNCKLENLNQSFALGFFRFWRSSQRHLYREGLRVGGGGGGGGGVRHRLQEAIVQRNCMRYRFHGAVVILVVVIDEVFVEPLVASELKVVLNN